jgi:hypothetical protein
MARSVEHIARTLEEALAALKDDPSQSVHAHIDNMDVELRSEGKPGLRLGDFMAEGGGWKGESVDEILRLLREARAAATSNAPPKLCSGCSIPTSLSMR